MPDTVAIERTYNGFYRHSADDKRRVPIPFRWRPEKSGDAFEFTLIVWRKHQAGTCLRVLPPEKFSKLRADIEAMANNNPRKSILKRTIGTSSAQAKLDTAGRITIPEEMAAAAGITNEVVLAGNLDRFELWNPERYKQVEQLDGDLEKQALEELD
jgi:MraZ protein